MTYPTTPGHKGTLETGRQGAEYFAPKVGRRQAEVLDALREGPGTAEEIAERTGRHWYITRPRISELKAKGLLVDTGERVASAFGGKTHRVRLATAEELAAFEAAKAAEASI
jgi:DNA-binding IclR family transcriptional regulator